MELRLVQEEIIPTQETGNTLLLNHAVTKKEIAMIGIGTGSGGIVTNGALGTM